VVAKLAPTDVASCDWLTLDEYYGDTWHDVGEWKGATWPNEGLPCGTRLLAWSIVWFIKIYMGPWGSTPGPLPIEILNINPSTTMPHVGFYNVYGF
jgi:hypothetical protein